MLAIDSVFHKFLSHLKVSLFALEASAKENKKAFILEFQSRLAKMNKLQMTFSYPLSDLENRGVIVHFSFDCMSKFFEM